MSANSSQLVGVCQMAQDVQLSWLVIDANVEEYQVLVEGAVEGINVFVLDGNQDGVQQITDLLQHQPASSLTLVAHGFPGGIRLGNTTLELNNLAQYAESLKTWLAGSDAELTMLSCQKSFQRWLNHRAEAD